MKQHKMRSAAQPQAIEITANAVYEASNIQSYHEEIDGMVFEGYEYDCNEYSLDEYLIKQNSKISALQDELQAAKILLGVD